MSHANRLAGRGRIDRSKPIIIQFNGREVPAYHGDTAASALIANGILHVGRSFKYHRPRGVLAAGAEEPNALLDIDRGNGRRDPNNRATVVEAFDGLVTRSQNHWPSLKYDVGTLNDMASPLFSAGFYYKTFMWPSAAWKRVYEPVIRRAAGLGKAPTVPDPDRYVHSHAHCDVLISGAGPAGLAAALAASVDGSRRIIIADEQNEFGGTLLHDLTSTIDGLSASDWVAQTVATLSQRSNVRMLPRTTVVAYYNHNHIALNQRLTDHQSNPSKGMARERLWQVRAGEVIAATGAHERPLVFAGNDRPGMLLADSLRAFINRYGVTPGRNVVIATSGASAYQAAIDAKSAGLFVTIVDYRKRDEIGDERLLATQAGIEILDNHSVIGSTGRTQVTGLIVAPKTASGGVGDVRTLNCDAVGMSGGWTPVVHLVSQSRAKLVFDTALDAFIPGEAYQSERSAGACRGVYALDECLANGHEAGSGAGAAPSAKSSEATGFEPVRLMPTNRQKLRDKAFVDFQNDVTAKDINLAVQEGFQSIEHVKRYTTTGMATDQGKTSNINALGIVAGALELTPPDVGTTTFRPPYTPTTFGAFAGQARGVLFDPERITPMHDWAVKKGAKFEDVALWKRAWYFPQGRETMHDAVQRECRAVRESVGIFDATTLGKIEVVGPDAAEFLNRIYTNSWLKLKPGRCRYGLMLKEDGYIMDDGVVARIADDRFHITTTTGGAPRVLGHMEDYLQTEFTDLKLSLTSTTEQWAVIAVQGPNARDVVAPLVSDIDMSNDAFPHMSMREGKVCGVPCRLFRVSFTGEAGYEINVPSDYGEAVWEAVYAAGQPYDITPYGTETMHVLRAEKGFIIVGQETDGTVTPEDVGLSGLVSKVKADFVGKRSLARPDLVAEGRKQLVGLLTLDPDVLLDEGAQIVDDPQAALPMPMLGHVTSSYVSPNVARGGTGDPQQSGDGRSIAMAMIAGGHSRVGTRLYATTREGFTEVQVTKPVFFDPDGGRANV
ncbi:MAG: sarcosine oxidase subunit alpha [Hyphomicrobiaceae bacterium]|jgi:sarcosine oxidase subunit alpha